MVHVWAGTFQAKNPWEPFLEEWLDLPFKGAALHKTDSVNSVDHLFVYNMFQYFTVSQSICNIIAH